MTSASSRSDACHVTLKRKLTLLDGVPVTEVARRYGVARPTVHKWLRRYAARRCPGRPVVSARIVSASTARGGGGAGERAAVGALRLGPDRILHQLAREQVVPLPGRSSVYRALVHNGLIDPIKRRRKRADNRRRERGRSM